MILKNEQEMKSFAKSFSRDLAECRVLALYGDLGSGKTTFVQGLAEGLGIERRILSPTFVFQRSYEVKNKSFSRLHHLDLYRLSDLKDAKSIGIEELFSEKNSVIAIEWPEIVEKLLPRETVKIRFKKTSESERELTVEKS